jgi:hypothetical protein
MLETKLRRVRLLFVVLMPVALVISTALFALLAGPVRALPDAGTETMNVTGEVGVTSRLGTETISFSGVLTIQRGNPYNDAGVDVVDSEIISLALAGDSVTGPVTVVINDSLESLGEIRSLQSPEMFPASSYFDLFIAASIPIDGRRSEPVIHNEDAIRIVPMAGDQEVSLTAWPPVGVVYKAILDPCVPLLPELPAEICVTDVSFELGAVKESAPADTPTPTTPPASDLGDANCDDAVNATDAVFLLQFGAGLINSLPCPEGGDVNGDGAFDALDATLILQFSAGLLDSF